MLFRTQGLRQADARVVQRIMVWRRLRRFMQQDLLLFGATDKNKKKNKNKNKNKNNKFIVDPNTNSYIIQIHQINQ